jgi:hypothetical protein
LVGNFVDGLVSLCGEVLDVGDGQEGIKEVSDGGGMAVGVFGHLEDKVVPFGGRELRAR